MQLQLFQYASAAGLGSAPERTLLNMMLKTGKAAQIPGTFMLMGEFQGTNGVHVYIEAPNMIAGQGTGGITINGQVHRATYADFYLVEGGVVVIAEGGIRADYHCQETVATAR